MSLVRTGRVIIYPNEIALETDILRTNMYRMTDIAFLCQALIGNGVNLATMLAGLACTPTSPASMYVDIAPGSIYQIQEYDANAYSSIPADTTDMLYKQGLNLSKLQFGTTATSPFVAPGSGTNYYLIQAQFLTQDVNNVNSPYFNSDNPTVPEYTYGYDTRQDIVSFSTKLSTSSTPAPDSSNVGCYAVTIPSGTTTITSGNIAVYPGAPFITGSIVNAVTFNNLQQSYPIYGVDTGTANVYVVSPAVPYATYVAGTRVFVKIVHANTGASTLNISSVGAVAIVDPYGNALTAGLIGAGMVAEFIHNGTAFVLLNPMNLVTDNQLQKSAPIFAADTGTLNTLVVAPSPVYQALVLGSRIYVQIGTTNKGATTLNVNSLGAVACRKTTSAGIAPLVGFELIANYIYEFIYDGTHWLLLGQVNPPLRAQVFKSTTQNIGTTAEAAILYDVFTASAVGGGWSTDYPAYDPFAMFNSTNTFTAPIAGYWEIKASVSFYCLSANPIAATLNLYLNNTSSFGNPYVKLAQCSGVGAGGAYITLNGSVIVPLNSGDTLTATLLNINSINGVVINQDLPIDSLSTFFTVDYVGA